MGPEVRGGHRATSDQGGVGVGREPGGAEGARNQGGASWSMGRGGVIGLDAQFGAMGSTHQGRAEDQDQALAGVHGGHWLLLWVCGGLRVSVNLDKGLNEIWRIFFLNHCPGGTTVE